MSNPPRIAVVGMAGRFPGASNLDAFWTNLHGGVESLTTFSDDELERGGAPRAMLTDPRCVKVAPSLGPIDRFDAAFFGFNRREAELLDPQQRLLLECAHEALEQAGCVPSRFDGRVGVYVGVGSNGYLDPVVRGINVVTELESALGNDKDYAATRLSYKLGLEGPSVSVQTACSTSLVAIHLACESLLSGACDLALAGGAKVRVPQASAYLYQEGALLSPDGRCRAFDAGANGTAFGSGAGVVAMKRFEDALAAGDVIDAVILGSAINNDGSAKVGYVAPSEDGQAAVIAEALAIAGVDAATIGYVEAHGTGTPLGDPIEIAALTRAFRERATKPAACAIGSVKTNIGHLETAAGVAGFIKTVLALKHRTIPASLNFRQPNPHIDFARTPFRVNAERREWKSNELARRAGVSSFGIGGTNAHVVLEEAPEPKTKTRSSTRVYVLPVSARSEPALRDLSERWAAELARRGADASWLEDACTSASLRRAHHEHRLCVAGETPEALIEGLRAPVPAPRHASAERPRVVFVYSGQGSQWMGMGRRLLREDAAFAARFRECDAALRGAAGLSVLEVLESDSEARWQRVEVIQPLLFAMHVSLSAAWAASGVVPDAVLGHSLGEVAASVVAGSLSLEDGAHVIGTRSRLVSRTSGRGRMALVELSLAEAERMLRDWPGVSIASHHGPETVLLSGTKAGVESVVRALDERGTFARFVDVDYASHSAEMDPILDELGAALAKVRGRPADHAVQFSTVLARAIDGAEVGGAYWVRNLREPVRFQESVEKLVGMGYTVFVEVSPHPVLAPTIERAFGDRALVLGTLRRGGDELLELATSVARLHQHGVDVDWSRRGGEGRFVRLPEYPWQRRSYWIPDAQRRGPVIARAAHPWLQSAIPNAAEPGVEIWQGELGRERLPHLEGHRVQGSVVVAAAIWVEAAMHIERVRGGPRCVEDVELAQMLALGAGETARVQLIAGASGFEVLSSPAGEDAWTRCARGRFATPELGTPDAWPGLAEVKERAVREVEGAALYARLHARGVEHDARYAAVRRLWIGDGEAVGELALEAEEPGNWELEPWWLDAALQVLGASEDDSDPRVYLPIRLGRVALHRRPKAGVARVHARWRRADDHVDGDLRAYDEEGALWLEATGVVLRAVGRRRDPVEDWLFARSWIPRVLEPTNEPTKPKTWLVLGDGPIAGELIEHLQRSGATCATASRGDLAVAVPSCDGIVHLWAAESDEPTSSRAITGAQDAGALSVLALVQALAKSSFRDPPRVWLVTRGAMALPGDPPARVTHAPIWGLARTIVHEHPELRCTCVDLPSNPDVAALARELLADANEDQVVLRPEGRAVARLTRTHLDAAPPALLRPADGRPFRLEIGRPGNLDTLALREVERRSPGRGEIEIEVEAAGLNLLDVLIALDVLRDDVPGREQGEVRLGGECSGRVTRLGSGVENLVVGDRVLALAHDTFRSFVVASASLTARIPSRVSFEQAAGFPLAFLTAHLALSHVARLDKGERILIHAASTGVGRAAVQLAQRIGAEIFATAGSVEKRERLRRAGVAHVMSSRSLDFVREVKRATADEGVDVVLNSLSGEFIPASLGLLRQHGRFVEIGKRDYYGNAKLGLAPFLKSLSFSLLDLRGLLYTRPRVVEQALVELVHALDGGAIEPLATEAFPIACATDAMRTMAEARHTEKIVLRMRDPKAEIALPRSSVGVRQDATYLVTGGLGALGLEVAGRLVERGARRVVLMGRHAPSPAAEVKIEALTDAGAAVSVERGDVADPADVARVVGVAVRDGGWPLAGVVHAAGVLDDGILVRQDARRFATVMAPKVAGAWNLHLETRSLPLDFFVLFSSTASLLGAPGQGNYAAASAFLDALAHHRRALGLAALAIHFGPWAEIGLAAAAEDRGTRAAGQGMHGLAPREGLAAFEALFAGDFIEVGVVRLDVRQWIQSHPLLAASPLFRALVEEGEHAPVRSSRLREALSSAPEGERRAMLERHLRQEVARVLRIPPETIGPSSPLSELGLGSLTALEYRNRLEATLGVQLPATLIWSHPTTSALAEQVATRLGIALAREAPAAETVASRLAEEIDQLSDELAEEALLAVLNGLEAES